METGYTRRSRCRQLVISLYFHIPFCTKKCPYCHFYVVPNQPLFHTLLEEGLEREWERNKTLIAGKEISSIYFGGGTPSLFPVDSLKTLLNRIQKDCILSPDCEITIEANPEESSLALFQALRSTGINRLSLGVQSLDNRSLQTLERTHSADGAIKAIKQAHEAQFQNISIDLMYDLPDQTLSSWQYTLDQTASLPITHLSLYNLTIEPHTSFYKRRSSLILPNAEQSLQYLNLAIAHLEKTGLTRYEISAFSKPGFQSRHNLGYWTARPFLGFGPSAFSYWDSKRFQNIANLHRYTRNLKEEKSPIDFSECLSPDERINELLAVRLRLLEGVDLELFPALPAHTRLAIDQCIKENYLSFSHPRIQLTEKGLLFYDTVASIII